MYTMKPYSVAKARQYLADVLTCAEEGKHVVIERRGVRFRITVEARPKPVTRRPPRIEIVSDDVASGEWSFSWTDGGVTFGSKSKA
jgi:hypothetical protein